MARMTGAEPNEPKVFRPSREHVIAIVMMMGIALIGIGWAPKYLFWVLIFYYYYLFAITMLCS